MNTSKAIDAYYNLPRGALLSDGMGTLAAEVRPVLDMMIVEHGSKFAPFHGLTANEVQGALQPNKPAKQRSKKSRR